MPAASNQKRMTNPFRAGILRCFIFVVTCALANCASAQTKTSDSSTNSGAEARAYSVQVLTRIAEPVLTSLANNTKKKKHTQQERKKDRVNYAPLEAFGRALSG